MRVLDQGLDYKQRMKLEDEKLYIETIQQDESILEINKAIQAAGGANSLDFGQPVLNMPFVAWMNFVKQYPELTQGDVIARKRIIAQICRDHPEYVISAKPKYHQVG